MDRKGSDASLKYCFDFWKHVKILHIQRRKLNQQEWWRLKIEYKQKQINLIVFKMEQGTNKPTY